MVLYPNINMEGWSTLFSIFLITRISGVSGGTPALGLTAAFQPAQVGQGVVLWREPYLLKTKGTNSQQEDLKGVGGAKGEALGFSLSWESKFSLSWGSESCSDFAIIAVSVKFMSAVFEEGFMPKVLANKCFKFTSSLYLQ